MPRTHKKNRKIAFRMRRSLNLGAVRLNSLNTFKFGPGHESPGQRPGTEVGDLVPQKMNRLRQDASNRCKKMS